MSQSSVIDFQTATPLETVEYFTDCEWGKVYADDKYFSDADIEDNFIVFCTYAFAHQNLPRPSKAQYYIALHLSDKTNPHRMVWASRGLGKSLFSQLYVTWRLLNDPDEHILVMSASSNRASNYTGFIKKLIGLLPITQPMQPRHNRERTSSVAFDVAGASASDSPSMYAVGIGTAVTGMRASLVVADDIESSVSVTSSVKTETTLSQFYEAMNLLMSGKDETLILSTPHSSGSIYIELIDRGWKLLALPSQVPIDASSYFGGLSPHIQEMVDAGKQGIAVDERLDLAFLESKRTRIGKSNYQLQYMLDTTLSDMMKYPLKLSDFIVDDVDDDTAPLKISYSSMPDNMLYIKHNGFKGDKFYKPTYKSKEMGEYDYKVMSIDPSGRGADGTGIAIGYHLNTRIFLKKCMNIAGGYEPEVMKDIATLAQVHSINTIVIESNFGDGIYSKMLEPYLQKISPLTEIEEVRATTNKENRIIDTIEPMLNSHRLVIDKSILDADLNAKRDYSLTHQLTHITREKDSLRHDDVIDALSQLIAYMSEWISNSEDWGMETHNREAGKDALEFTLKHFNGSPRRRVNGNLATNF